MTLKAHATKFHSSTRCNQKDFDFRASCLFLPFKELIVVVSLVVAWLANCFHAQLVVASMRWPDYHFQHLFTQDFANFAVELRSSNLETSRIRIDLDDCESAPPKHCLILDYY